MPRVAPNCLNPLIESYTSQQWVIHGYTPSWSHSTYWFLARQGVTETPQNSCTKSKTTSFHQSLPLTAGSAASLCPWGHHPRWIRKRWYCGPHRGPSEIQSWRAWTPYLKIEIQPRRQKRAVRPLLPFYWPQTLLRLFKA